MQGKVHVFICQPLTAVHRRVSHTVVQGQQYTRQQDESNGCTKVVILEKSAYETGFEDSK